jgi:exopolysaccharide production protein ExoQ
MSQTRLGREPIGRQRMSDRPAALRLRESWAEAWVETYALSVFGLMFLYQIFGIPGGDPSDTSQTDRVDPFNAPIWILLLLLSLPIAKMRWREVLALLKGSWALLALFAYFTASILWALDPGTSLRRTVFTFVQFFVVAHVLVGIRRPHKLHILMACICCICALADFVVYILAAAKYSTDEGFFGLQSQKNQAGLLMMLGYLSSVTAIFLVKRWLFKLFLLGCIAIMCLLLVATRSSTSESVVVGATVVMPVLMLIATWPGRTIRAIAAVSVTAIVLVVFGYLLYCGVTGYDPWLPFRDMTFTNRLSIWEFVIDEIVKRPWFGSGYSSFWAIDPTVQPSLKTDGWFAVYVVINEGHNGYLDQLATGGIFGLLGSLFVVFRTLGVAGSALNWAQCAPQSWRVGMLSYPTTVFYMAYILGLLLHNFTESNLFDNNQTLATAFLICALDLEKWRVSVRNTGRILLPRRRPAMASLRSEAAR